MGLYLYSLYCRLTSGGRYLGAWWIDAFGSWLEPRARGYSGWQPPGEPALRLLAIHPCSDGLSRPEALLHGSTACRRQQAVVLQMADIANPPFPPRPSQLSPAAVNCTNQPGMYFPFQTPLCHLSLGGRPTCSCREPNYVFSKRQRGLANLLSHVTRPQGAIGRAVLIDQGTYCPLECGRVRPGNGLAVGECQTPRRMPSDLRSFDNCPQRPFLDVFWLLSKLPYFPCCTHDWEATRTLSYGQGCFPVDGPFPPQGNNSPAAESRAPSILLLPASAQGASCMQGLV